ncbi:DHHW family protein [Papillibacter cinnamivorans]|uniref:SGNH hydrolase-like domain-containing protein, acetyltransferase AlgX n=1 Tax=Papillibacter cinnamivorans DSM 12816 TaxID=1122930 RepID=A0A1W2BSR1_9FIRM|nr:DHHW family protein [Papillibacter cinnamivorans]SMC76025.1 SGNH hydrolase-like domain-containing protein, acetyltransferase AlgX [Papillibacter cinnamivorans DSM 12816]
MKRTSTTAVAVLFLAALAAVFLLIATGSNTIFQDILKEYRANRPENPTLFDKAELAIGSAEEEICLQADKYHLLIELNGGFQRLLGKRVIDDVDADNTVVKLKNGSLSFALKGATFSDNSDCGQALADFGDRLEAQGIPLLYVQAPQKNGKDMDLLPEGIADYGNDEADALLAYLHTRGVASLDLREAFASASEPYESYFFRTDHHWKPEGAFLSFQTMAGLLNEKYGFTIPEAYTDLDQYTVKIYKDWFLGSQGKRVGTLYAGVDDISLISPKFETNLTFEVPFYKISRTGAFLDTVIDYTKIDTRDYYGNNPYAMYTGGDFPLNIIRNNLDPTGKRVLLIRDSYSCALAPFLALGCGELDIVDLRYFTDSLSGYIEKTKPNLVIVLYTAGTTANRTMFRLDT